MTSFRTRETIDNMRIVAGVLSLSVAACSFGMKRVEPDWDGSTEPECSDDPAPVIGDAIIAGLTLGVAAAAADDANKSNSSGSAGIAIGAAFVGLGFAVSGLVGEGTYKSCKEAKAQWRIGGAIGRASNAQHGDEARAEQFAREHPEVAEKPTAREEAIARDDAARLKKASVTAPVTPRGFYCASSPTNAAVGFCAHEKATCEQTHDLLTGAAPDLGKCTLVESAWCFGDRCAPTQDACRDMLSRAGGSEIDCAESE